MSGYSIWAPYVGIGAIILAIVLLIIAGIIAFLGTSGLSNLNHGIEVL